MENLKTVSTKALVEELVKRKGVQAIPVNEGNSVEIKADGEIKKITEPIPVSPVTILYIYD